MNIHLVYAHPHPASLNAALRDETVATLEALGHTVTIADLYAMDWKAAADTDDHGPTSHDAFMTAAAEAYRTGALAEDIRAEQQRLREADALVLQFPLWWFSVPAIMKGWIDRVFNNGFVHSAPGAYGDGVLAGKRALLVTTTGAPGPALTDRGISGALDDLLFPIQHGVLFYTGMQVLPAYAVNGATRLDAAGYADAVKGLRGRLETLFEDEPIPFRTAASGDYGDDNRLLPGREAPGADGFALHRA